jgi:hypothetical protein
MTIKSDKDCQAKSNKYNQNCCDYGCNDSYNCPAHQQMLENDRIDKVLFAIQGIALFVLVLAIIINLMDFTL